MAFAVIQTGGKQYRVSQGSTLSVEKLVAEPGSTVTFDSVLLYGGEGESVMGAPFISGATVTAEVVDQIRGEKLRVFTYKPKKRQSRTLGHRQNYTKLKVTEITLSTKKKAA